MSENQSRLTSFIICFLPLLFLISIDSFALYLEGISNAISHFSLAVFCAQFLVVLVCYKGELCNGQRSRLINVNNYFLIYWLFWLIISLFSNYHYVLTDMICLCGIGSTLAIYFQSGEYQSRRSILFFAILFIALGLFVCAFVFWQLPWVALLSYSPFVQLLLGIIMANLVLVISNSRLHIFMSLLPLMMIIGLFLSSVFSVLLIYLAIKNEVFFSNQLALLLYFLLHLVLVIIIAIPIMTKSKFSYQTLLLAFFITLSLPVWANFSFLP
ncbi:hypothetical protein L5B71_00185 [Avibacterium sp. 21-586]|uniref:hypothetical protein n=1 Tax=Avibacterium sp. 21-586 TaxID=2911534 RepID=UPI002246E699|nr:hypothetical protein [Avibacterium sp. 21-586]MCW9709314.1 hypothetical protein [Avibacterium sp. 21-586]